MKEYFISEINIEKLYHLSNITIELDTTKRQHLLLTGKNGSGKTSLLLRLVRYLKVLKDGHLIRLTGTWPEWEENAKRKMEHASSENERFKAEQDYRQWSDMIRKYSDGIKIAWNDNNGLESVSKGEFITAYFPAEFGSRIFETEWCGENIHCWLSVYDTRRVNAGNILLKYMVHMKTQQSFARNEGDKEIVERIQQWFDRFESALQVLLDEKSIHLEYDYKNYNFKIRQEGREPFEFSELSDGYSSVIYIVSDLILRMDKNWLLGEEISQYNAQGIVLIDELETHLHIELQKKILPFLTEFFPNIQFIVTTHSPYILNSISNAKAYDLEKHVELENLAAFSSDELAEGYFEADEYSDTLKEELERYAQLCSGKELTEEERAERAELKIKFKNLSTDLSGAAREKFEDIERRRETND
ncbi:MAG: AAA family ATPase [Lachnospiraceae bacterium]